MFQYMQLSDYSFSSCSSICEKNALLILPNTGLFFHTATLVLPVVTLDQGGLAFNDTQ